MKKKQTYNQRGQALVLIALAIVGLVGFTALAIDGGNVFSDRRHSQNSSDTAVLAAALERVRRPTENWKAVAIARAGDNGYVDADPETEVNVHLCSETGLTTEDGLALTCNNLPADAKPEQYVHVHIKSVVHLFFAPVIGWRTVTNHTDAIARASIPVPTKVALGYGIWSTHEGCTLPGDGEPFEVGGSANNKVIGAGVLVNAKCALDDSFVQNGNPKLNTTTGICVNGTANYDPSEITSDIGPSVKENCPPVNRNTNQDPPPPDICNTTPRTLQPSPTDPNIYYAIPGAYESEFPNVNGTATVILTKGIYCLKDGIQVNSQTTLTTDSNLDGDFDELNEGVLLYLPGLESSDDITINGGATININAITYWSGSVFDNSWYHLLIYVNPEYETDVTLSGNSGSTYTGTIYVPSAHVTLEGATDHYGGTVKLDSQIIADTVKLTGNTDFELHYDESKTITTLSNPDINMIE